MFTPGDKVLILAIGPCAGKTGQVLHTDQRYPLIRVDRMMSEIAIEEEGDRVVQNYVFENPALTLFQE